MSPIRLAYLMGRMARGGAELQMIALIDYLTRNGASVDLFLRDGDGPLDDEVRAAGATLHMIGSLHDPDPPAPVAYGRRLRRYARWASTARGRFDIVDSWVYPADVETALARPLTRTPVLMSARLGRSPRARFGPATRLIESVVNRWTDVVVANAQVTADDAVKGGVSANRVRIIRGGVRPPRGFSNEERRAQRAALGIKDEHFLVGNVGNFRPMKRHDLLLHAMARLLPGHPSLRLVLVGDGDLRPRIEQHIRRLGLDERVVLIGSVTDPSPLYDAMDLFVQASNSEGLPNVLLEAASAGLPIVATDAGGSGELVQDGKTGLLVPIDDLDRLVAAIVVAISDPELCGRLGQAALELVTRDYGMERFLREYAELYRNLLAQKRGLVSASV